MSGSVKCQPGCTCRKHTGEFQQTDWSDPAAVRAYAREYQARKKPKVPCPGCGQPKVGHAKVCWECHVKAKQQQAETLEQRRKRQREYMRAMRANDPDGAWVEKERERNRVHGARYHIKSVFGITLEQRDAMFDAQGGCCYLCGEPLEDRVIHIDHDQSCCRGRKSCGTCIRGLACQLCNQGIGQFGDDPERMRRVADNLEMANRRVRDIPRLQEELFSTTRGSDTAGRPGE